jgi:predicted kinase
MLTGGVPDLIVVVGPIASGKSTVARGLARRLRDSGRDVAELDLDDLVETIGGFVELRLDRFRQAQIVYGELVGAWLRQGFDVIAHGPFFHADEQAALLHAVPHGVTPRRVLLLATYEIALARVAADPGRVFSKQPDLLRNTYDRVATLLPTMPENDWNFDTTVHTCEAIVDVLAASLGDRDRC